ncbi:hypothetical protein KTE54_19815 [Burkholderia multivorans]|uniref:hypothetical protein n=1 Tax=Burkholderia multivorans TaxID=87883 RepID=UPI001C252107|nr:hypothetical protein [Burkholderia multivorans]MBU9562935.1 hypothetical protein [Burkholderia multivorans]
MKATIDINRTYEMAIRTTLNSTEASTMKRIFAVIFSLFIILATTSAPAKSIHENKPVFGKSYICHFGKYGIVTIDTRDPGASITISGVRHPATDGSYFYQTDDGKTAIAFNPKMTIWTYLSEEEPNGITDSHCKVQTNKK